TNCFSSLNILEINSIQEVKCILIFISLIINSFIFLAWFKSIKEKIFLIIGLEMVIKSEQHRGDGI
ncbi:MAG TPA: hypothetical protein VF084_09150, partial [Nitrososphaeraceae archaeon]